MFSAFALVLLISYFHLMSTALIIILGVICLALIVLEGIICGKITCELVHKKDADINEVLWFWLGFIMSWVGILLTLVVKPADKKE